MLLRTLGSIEPQKSSQLNAEMKNATIIAEANTLCQNKIKHNCRWHFISYDASDDSSTLPRQPPMTAHNPISDFRRSHEINLDVTVETYESKNFLIIP